MLRWAFLLVASAMLGCDGASGTGGPSGPGGSGLRICEGRPYIPASSQGWRHLGSQVTAAAGSPTHAAPDVLVKPGTTATLTAKFAYGLIDLDLEDETVRVSIDDCSGWIDLGDHLTNGEGRISVPAPADLPVGGYEVRYQVLADQSTATSFVWVLPFGTHLTVTDIDGTLTASDAELFMQIFDGSHVPVAYPSAVDLTTAHAGRRDVVLYLTGRPPLLMARTRAWLSDLGFARGPLFLTDDKQQALPTEAGVGDYKKTRLQGLLAAGYDIDFAYGNAPTDIYAYIGAPIRPAHIWIIGDAAGEMGTNPVTGSWDARVAEVKALPPVAQPYAP